MRHVTHEAIGMAAYSIVINLVYNSKTLCQFLILLLLTPIVFITSKSPDKIDGKFKLPHREISHSITIWMLLSILVTFLTLLCCWIIGIMDFPIKAIVIAFSLSYLMHILADSFTDNGVRLLWPLNRHKPRRPIYRFWYYRDGEKYENYIRYTANILSLIIWISIFYQMVM